MIIKENYEKIEERIQKACQRSGRKREEVILLAASKTQPVEKILQAYQCGIRYFGENRVQEGIEKIGVLKEYKDIHWHLIGGLQTNKVKYAVKYFEMIHSVDREDLVDELEKRASKINKVQEGLIEVNFGEESKFGVKEEDLKKLFEYILTKKHIKILGLMAIPPYFENLEDVRPFFRKLRQLKEELEKEFNLQLPHLSMGMSHDFEVAIEEGSTIVRIGTALFGERK
ncbi:YggS family pyridoxal phosphate-dependent enzyme [Sulfurihydrogenibium subterraneum]|uniref:YggS family pyridoxal phosphate-dependent enzyme n=1 Tax=Sulfurihydrogenibium subterraneum TaxID=171121 RepID=UPI00048E9A15|nr:YggS family pyridoxal phosphate-dependent enzyme [Sulfurihydrogenibium subterraneum]